MSKGRHAKAYESMCRLRYIKVQAARDLYYMHKGLEAEQSIKIGQNKIFELVTVPRNRRQRCCWIGEVMDKRGYPRSSGWYG